MMHILSLCLRFGLYIYLSRGLRSFSHFFSASPPQASACLSFCLSDNPHSTNAALSNSSPTERLLCLSLCLGARCLAHFVLSLWSQRAAFVVRSSSASLFLLVFSHYSFVFLAEEPKNVLCYRFIFSISFFCSLYRLVLSLWLRIKELIVLNPSFSSFRSPSHSLLVFPKGSKRTVHYH